MAVFKGSCLCESICYSISGEPLAFYHCHCRCCRKANGTGRASNICIDAQMIAWEGDQSLIKHYKAPEAERFRSDFCSEFGSPLPRYFDQEDFIVLPAGTLDHEPASRPQARIFNDSRAEWSCKDDVPFFETYPV